LPVFVASKGQEKGKACRPKRDGQLISIEIREAFLRGHRQIGVVVILALVGLTACGIPEMMRRLGPVRAAAIQAAGPGVSAVSINLINGRYLAIIIDYPQDIEDGLDKSRDKALGVAKAAFAAYDRRSTLDQVTVAFATIRTAFFVVTIRRDGNAFVFRPSDLIAVHGVDQVMPRPPDPISLYVLPLGTMPRDLTAQLTSRLQTRFPIPVTELPPLPLDPTAYNDRRHQFVAEDLIATVRHKYAAPVAGT
jgi:hypothetical protein